MPRFSPNQIRGMQERMKEWFADVEDMQSLVEAKAQDILT